MSDVIADAETASSGNPAGRVIRCMAPLINNEQVTISNKLGEVLEIDPRSPRFAVSCAELRVEAYGIPDRVERYMTQIPGARRSFEGYQSIRQLADALIRADSTTHLWMLQNFTEKGWSALCWADEILAHYEPEPTIRDEDLAELLTQVRELIDQVLACDEFTGQEQDHIVGLLRDVEHALLAVKIHGTGGLENSIKAVVGDVLANPGFWSRQSKASKAIVGAIGAFVFGASQFFSAYPGMKDFAVDWIPRLAITATVGSQPDHPMTGPVVDESKGPR